MIIGLDGTGKTTLAREVAQGCIDGKPGLPRFEAAMWIDVSKLPGTPTLRGVLDAMSYAFKSPGFAQLAEDEQRRKIERLLELHKVLLVIDNFEATSDHALLDWLLYLPAPSRALITTREDRTEFYRAWAIELGGLSQEESREYIRQQLQASKAREEARDLHQFRPLIEITDGNPAALNVCLGLYLYAHRSIGQIMDDLRSGRMKGFDGIWGRTWSLLDKTARQILCLAALFPTGASREALGGTANVQGAKLTAKLKWLENLRLLDVQQPDLAQPARYAVHSLVEAFIQSKLQSQPQAERKRRVAWLEWAVRTAAPAGWAWQDLRGLRCSSLKRRISTQPSPGPPVSPPMTSSWCKRSSRLPKA